MDGLQRRIMALVLVLCMLIGFVPVDALAQGQTPSVVLYEAYGGGGNSGAAYKNDYIILKNTGDKPVDLTGMKVGYFSAKKTGGNPSSEAQLQGNLAPGAYYVIKCAQGSGGTEDLPRFDSEANILMSGKNFALRLYDNGGGVIDTLGVGTAKIFSGTVAKGLSNTTAAQRNAYTGDNSKDWDVVQANSGHLDYLNETPVTPTDPTEPTDPTPPAEEAITVKEARDAAEGAEVVVEGIVTFSGADGNTFIQDDTAGIDIYKVATPLPVGTKVRVTGKRSAYAGQVQISQTKVENLGQGTLPAPQEITLADLSKDEYNGKRVLIKGAKISELNKYGDPILEQNGTTAQIYRAPKGDYKATDTVDVIGVCGVHNGKGQLRVQEAKDITVKTSGDGPAPVDPLPTAEEDPLTDAMIAIVKKQYPDALTIPQVQKIHAGFTPNPDGKGPQTVKKDVTVIGVATYVYAGGNALIIEDVVDGQVWGYQIFGPTETVELGDVVVAKGNLVSFYGLPEMSNVEVMKKVGQSKPVPPQVLTVAQIKENADKLVNEYVQINDVTLPAYKGEYSIDMKDATGTLPSYRTPAYPIGTKAGDMVGIRGAIAPHRGNPQIRMNDHRDYILKEDKLAPFIIVDKLMDARAGMDYTFTVDVADNVGATALTAAYGDKTIQLEKNSATGKWLGTIPGNDLVGKDSLTLRFTATDEAGNESTDLYNAPFKYGESKTIGKTITLTVDNSPQIADPKPANNEATKANKRPEISVALYNVSNTATAAISLNGGEAKAMTLRSGRAVYIPDADLKDGRVEAKVVVKDGAKSKEFTWKFYIGEALVKHYRGQLHSHSNYSDGAGTPADAIDYASKADTIDFFALTDHSNYFDDGNNLGKIDDATSGLRAPDGSNRSKWQAYKAYFKGKATADFLPLYGYEMTWTKSGANYGHMNTFNTEGFVSRNDSQLNDKNNSAGLLRYYELISKLPDTTFSQFNHPGTTFGTFDDFAHYDAKINENVKLVEVGNGEGPVHGNGYFPSIGEYTKALDAGWKLAPSNNQDNHKGKWGDANDARTVVIADGLTKEDIIKAIRNLSVYASEDKNITVDFAIDGKIMGSTMTDAKDQLNVTVDVAEKDGESIGTVDIVTTGGKVVRTLESAADTANFTFTLDNRYPYYYVLITQADGDHVVTAPIWTGDVKVAGITVLNPANGNEATVGAAKTLNYTFKADGEKVTKVEVFDGKDQIGTAEGYDAKGEVEKSVDATPKTAGKRTLTLKVTTDKGTYTKNVDITAYPEGLTTSTIADAQKSNEGEVFQLEGVLTSNASGYDKNTAFFDSAYIQDATGGINIFPIAGDFKEGDKIRVRGVRGAYQGERQLSVTSVKKLNETEAVQPKALNTGDVEKNTGLLVQTKGEVKEMNGDKSKIVIDDGSGSIRIFIDGYIGRPNSDDKSMPSMKVGDTVEAVGLSSVDPEGSRIRIRNRDDVKVLAKGNTSDPGNDKPNPGNDKKDPQKPGDNSAGPHKPSKRRGGYIAWIPVGPTTADPVKNPTAETAPKASRFIDVHEEDWFADIVDKIVAKGILVGTSENTFSPNGKASRGMVVTMLYRMEGKPAVKGAGPFTDVEANAYYADPIAWAAEKGVAKGVSDERFAPNDEITREAFVTLVYRYMVAKGEVKAVTPKENLIGVSDWAQEAMNWAVEEKIIFGRENGDLAAKSPSTRAEIAAIVLRTTEK